MRNNTHASVASSSGTLYKPVSKPSKPVGRPCKAICPRRTWKALCSSLLWFALRYAQALPPRKSRLPKGIHGELAAEDVVPTDYLRRMWCEVSQELTEGIRLYLSIKKRTDIVDPHAQKIEEDPRVQLEKSYLDRSEAQGGAKRRWR